MTAHPRSRLDELIHQPVRFSIMAALAAAAELEFGFVRDTVEVSDSLLSRYITQLENAGYVDVRKGYVGRRPRTWLSLSAAGRAAYAAHIEALQAIAGDSLTNRETGQSRPKPSTSDDGSCRSRRT